MFAVKFLFVLSLSIALVNCDVESEESEGIERIVAGTKARPGQFPFLAALRLANGQNFCGATIITQRHLLTSARCFIPTYRRNMNNIRAYVGAHSLRDGTMHRVTRLIKHPQFSERTFFNDAAVLQLVTQIQLVPGRVQLARLPQQDIRDGTRAQVSLVGWGPTQVMIDRI